MGIGKGRSGVVEDRRGRRRRRRRVCRGRVRRGRRSGVVERTAVGGIVGGDVAGGIEALEAFGFLAEVLFFFGVGHAERSASTRMCRLEACTTISGGGGAAMR
jgi:hypothetical protein